VVRRTLGELFTLCAEESERQDFLDLLARIAQVDVAAAPAAQPTRTGTPWSWVLPDVSKVRAKIIGLPGAIAERHPELHDDNPIRLGELVIYEPDKLLRTTPST